MGMEKPTMIYSYNKVILINKMKQTIDTNQ